MEGAVRYHSTEVDLSEENNSHTQLVLLTGHGKNVLEVGPATGFLSEILRERGCRVTGLEIDPEAAAIAAQFCDRILVGNVEEIDFAETFGDELFDVVMYGDVLEHLVDPGGVLRKTQAILAPGGSVVISVPNISHGSVRLSLLAGTFNYTEVGLLDRTHLRFFTRQTLGDLLRDTGYEIEEWRETRTDAFGTEIALREEMFPPFLVEAMRADPDAWVYQYVVSARAVAADVEGEPAPAAPSEALTTLWDSAHHLRAVEAALESARHSLVATESHIREQDAALRDTRAELGQLQAQLIGIQNSTGYRLLERYRRLMRWLFPAGSIRGIPYRAVRKVLRLCIRALGVIRREGFRALFGKVKRRLTGRGAEGERQTFDTTFERKIAPLTFPATKNPRVSIVIPAYNKALHTFNCLKAVLENTQNVDYEVIVADDCSSDETEPMLASMENVRTVRSESNLGFLRNCNQAMRAALGEYVVLLNNDTQVQKGWLEALVRTIDDDDTVGLVGAKLILPEGTLQEAGVIIWQDGRGYGYGGGKDPAAPRYNFVREVDYCSAACAIMRRSIVEKLGGFDERFAPAYFEDTDLCFAIRDLGYRVLYQPDAAVIHREGTSSGHEGSQALQQRNRPVFVDKWLAVLERDHLPAGANPELARDRRRGKRVMVIDEELPRWDMAGGELRMYWILRLLNEMGMSVTFVPANGRRAEPYTHELQQLGIEVLYGRVPMQEIGPLLDVVVISRPEVAERWIGDVRRFAPQAQLVYDTVDLHWIREMRRAEIENSDAVRREAERCRRMELSAVRASDSTIVVSPAEVPILQQEVPGVRVHVIPSVHAIEAVTPGYAERKDLMFVGYYPHLPNRDAMLYFIREILPLVNEEIPDLRLICVGPEPGPELEALAGRNVVVTGWVKELGPYLNSSRVFVAPLRYGAGIKGKILESMSHRLPVVTTSIGAEGIGLTDGFDAMVADDPAEFARKVVDLYRDRETWEALSVNGLDIVERGYSPEVIAASLRAIVEASAPVGTEALLRP